MTIENVDVIIIGAAVAGCKPDEMGTGGGQGAASCSKWNKMIIC